jgi:uncharacterized membrane protein (UPF0127 family)
VKSARGWGLPVVAADFDERFRCLPRRELPGGLVIVEAATGRARRRGLSGLASLPADLGFLIPRTRAIQTFEMRFALDLIWLGADGGAVRVDRGVRPRRMRMCGGARSVIEVAAGRADAFVDAGIGVPQT